MIFMNIRGVNDRISSSLAVVMSKVTIENNVNDYGMNVLLETSYLKILNVLYDLNLVNANLIKRNFPGVDGIDTENKIFVQVSATCTNEKIENTITQILKSETHNDFTKLFFVCLKDKKAFTKNFRSKIEALIDSKFEFDFDTDIIDSNDIYNLIFNFQDIEKSLGVKKILDNVLGYLPSSKETGFDFVCISFDDEEIENAKTIIDRMISQGLNVYIESEKTYQYFEKVNHRFFDYLLLYKEGQKIDFVNKYIVIVSNKYIKKNIDTNTVNCPLLKKCIANGISPKIVSFSANLNNILNKEYRIPKTIAAIDTKKIDTIIAELFSEKPSSKYNFEQIEALFLNLFPSYELNIISKEKAYCLYQLKMIDNDNELNYLVFGYDFKKDFVITEFENKYKNKYSKNLNVLIPKDYNQSTELRIKGIKDKFKYAKVVSYVDQFLYDKSLQQFKPSPILNNENFIEPLFKIDGSFEKINDILDWVKNDAITSVAFIKGAGGIGKTTVSEKIHDEIINKIDNNKVVFLSANSYIDQIKSRDKDNTHFDLMSIFDLCHTKAQTLDLNVFKSNFILGNITVIIDGIDEIISTLPNFSLKDFVNDFQVLKEQIGRGKLIINSRDIYINELEEEDSEFVQNHKVFELLMFDIPNVEKYFEKKFPKINGKSNKKTIECIKILNEFYEDTAYIEYKYSPFVLEIIALIVENDFVYDDIEYNFTSNILIREFNNDYLIYKICEREIAKKDMHGHIPNLDDFVKFLCLVAVEKNGFITDIEFINLLRKVQINLSSDKVKESLRDNPFFKSDSNSNYRFRFDFYNSMFKFNALFSKIIDNISFDLSDSFIEMIANEFKHNSLLFIALRKKLLKKELSSDDFIEKIKIIMSEIRNYKKDNNNEGDLHIKKQSISNLFLFAISFCEKHENKSQILKDLFFDMNESNTTIDVIKGLYLIDVPSDNGFVLDFEGFYFIDCDIQNYPEFINCKFNEDTYFSETCKISNIVPTKYNEKNITASKDNFDDRILTDDNTLFKLMKIKEGNVENSIDSIKRYFKSFYSSASNRINLETNLIKINEGKKYCIPFDSMTQILMNYKIIKSFENDIVYLNKDFSGKIDKFMNQNLPFTELNKVLKEIDKIKEQLLLNI